MRKCSENATMLIFGIDSPLARNASSRRKLFQVPAGVRTHGACYEVREGNSSTADPRAFRPHCYHQTIIEEPVPSNGKTTKGGRN
jgi:hypothetical protein